ncbi:MAG: chaperone modulator CbpM [Sandaracinaceae bacterium]
MGRRIPRAELLRLLEVDEAFLVELERHEILGPPDPEGCYDAVVVERVRVCWTMVHSLGVNLPGVEVALTLLEHLERERTQVRTLVDRIQAEWRKGS